MATASKEQADFNRHFGAKSPTTTRSTHHSSHMGPDMVEQPEQHSREEPEATVVQAWRAKYQAGMAEKEQKIIAQEESRNPWTNGTVVKNDVLSLQSYLRCSAVEAPDQCGGAACCWADAHAVQAISDKLGLGILLVDAVKFEDYAPGDTTASPYRLVATPRNGVSTHYVVLRLSQLHYEPLGATSPATCLIWEATKLPGIIRSLWGEKPSKSANFGQS